MIAIAYSAGTFPVKFPSLCLPVMIFTHWQCQHFVNTGHAQSWGGVQQMGGLWAKQYDIVLPYSCYV